MDNKNVGVCSPKGDHNNICCLRHGSHFGCCMHQSLQGSEREKKDLLCVVGGPKHAYAFCCSIHACFETTKVTYEIGRNF